MGTKAKIIGFTPSSITLGQKTTLIGTGDLSEDVSGASYDLTMTGAIGQLLHCTGDAAASKTCGLPMGVDTLTFDAMNFPIAPGKVSVRVDIFLRTILPGALLNTKTVAKATAKNGDQLFCLEIHSAAASDSSFAQNLALAVPTSTIKKAAVAGMPGCSTMKCPSTCGC